MTTYKGVCERTERMLGFKSVSLIGSLIKDMAGHRAMVLNWKRAILD